MVNAGRRWILPCLLALLGLGAARADVQVSVDRNPVLANESFQLQFELDWSPQREPDFTVLERDFTLLGSNRSSNHSIVNGAYKRSVRYHLRLMAEQAGEYEIPSIRFDDEPSRPLRIAVRAPADGATPESDLALEMMIERDASPVQAQLIVTLRLTSATGIAAYQFAELDISGVDAMVESLGDDRQFRRRIDDRAYLVLEKRIALYPQQVGRLDIAPPVVEVRLPSRRRYDPFNSGGEIRRLRADAASIDIQAPPAEFVGMAWLPAKRVELRERWQGDLTALAAGEPVTRSLTLVAEGLTAAQLPEIELPPVDGLRQYPDRALLDDSRTVDGITGLRQRKVALIPGAAGEYRLPEIRLPWWNVENQRIEYATLPAQTLRVAPAAITTPVQAAAAEARPQQPVVVIRNNPFWPWFSLLLAVGWALSALYWWWQGRSGSPAADAIEWPALGGARRRLRRACAAGNAVAARAALLDWGRALLAPERVDSLRDLGRLLGEDLAREIDRLNQSLYAQRRGGWDGAPLAVLCARLERARGAAADDDAGLQPLNP